MPKSKSKGSGQAETPEKVQVRVAEEIGRFLSENSDCAKSFREKIRPLGEQYPRWYEEVDRDKVRCEQEQAEDQETAKHDPRRRDHDREDGPPTDEYEWCDLSRALDPDGVYWGKDARAKGRQHKKMFEAIRRQGWDVTREEFESAWKEGHWGYWRRRWFNPVERLHKYLGLERVRVAIDPNPIRKRYKWVERFKPTSSIEAEVRDYVILAALHDIVLPDFRTRITEDLWSKNLLDEVWQPLRTWRGADADKSTFVQEAWKAVKEDLSATIEAQSTTGDKPGLSMTGEKMSDADRIKRFARFFRNIARQADKLLEMEPNRAFLRKKVEEFFRCVAESEAADADSLDAREECERFIQDQERPGDYVIHYTGGGTDAHGPRRWAVHKILVDGSEEECFKGPEFPKHVNPLDWFPPHAAWWSTETGDVTGNEVLLRNCVLIALIHDDHYAHHQPVAFFGAETPAWPGRFDILDGGFWPDRFRKKLLGFFWIPDADSPEVVCLKDFIKKALKCVRAAMPEGPEPKTGGDGSGESGTAKGISLSRPMPLTDLADRILKSPTKTRKLKSVYGNILHRLGDKSWQIELAGLPENIREQIERA